MKAGGRALTGAMFYYVKARSREGTEMGPVDREVTTPGKGKGGKEAQVLRDRRLKAGVPHLADTS